ncbi:MAG: sulfotransferase [Pseudoxanthomonas sp.]
MTQHRPSSAQAQTAVADPAPTDQRLWSQARAHITQGHWNEATHTLEALLLSQAEVIPVLLLLASVSLATGSVRGAVAHLQQAAASLPDNIDAIGRVAQALSRIGETRAAHACLSHPGIALSANARALLMLAHVSQGLGLHVEALALMERAHAIGLDSADFRYFHALQLQFNGRIGEAEAKMESCLAMGPTFGRASLTLARVRRQTAASNHLPFIRSRLAAMEQGSEDHAAFEFALHKELDDLGQCEEAWQALQRGNGVMQRRLGHDGAGERAIFDALIARFDTQTFAQEQAAPDGPVPIFIVGMPRSGTTLLERILGNHSMVMSTGELADFPRQLRWATDLHGHALVDLPLLEASRQLDFPLLGRRYLYQTQWRAQGRRFYVDKLPPNFMLIGFIRHALPHARILHMVRDPMDVCFSNYRALFGDAYAYSYDLESLAHHHRQYQRLMRHWHRTLPGFVLDIDYDEMVRHTGSATRRILGFCGLPYETTCLETTANDSPVATLSSAQVRAPIHQRSAGEWRRYGPQLDPLQRMLLPG